MYWLNFGKVRNVDMDKVNKLIENHDSDKAIGIDKIFDLDLEKLSSDIQDRERDDIIRNYWDHADAVYRNEDLNEEHWVSDNRLNRNKGYSSRAFTNEFMEDFKNIRGGREFFRSIKDEYNDNSTHPNIEVCLINTSAFKSAIKTLANEAVENEDDLTSEQIDFIKWVFWWGTQSLKRGGNKASIRFAKD